MVAKKAAAPKAAEVEVDDEVETAQPRRTGAPEEASPELEEDQVTGPSSLGFVQRPEVEITAEAVPKRPMRRPQDPNEMVEVRMARTIEEFTYGNPHRHYHLEAGRRYKLPFHVAQYLDGLEALHHRV